MLNVIEEICSTMQKRMKENQEPTNRDYSYDTKYDIHSFIHYIFSNENLFQTGFKQV